MYVPFFNVPFLPIQPRLLTEANLRLPSRPATFSQRNPKGLPLPLSRDVVEIRTTLRVSCLFQPIAVLPRMFENAGPSGCGSDFARCKSNPLLDASCTPLDGLNSDTEGPA